MKIVLAECLMTIAIKLEISLFIDPFERYLVNRRQQFFVNVSFLLELSRMHNETIQLSALPLYQVDNTFFALTDNSPSTTVHHCIRQYLYLSA